MVMVALPPGLMAPGESVHFTPTFGGAEQLRLTESLKPPTAVTATTKVVEPPAKIVGGVGGDAATEKSGRSKVATTFWSLVAVKEHEPVPEHGPLQPSKPEPGAADAVRLTVVPGGKTEEHCEDGQLIPGGVLVTVPVPLPKGDTLIVGGPVKEAATF